MSAGSHPFRCANESKAKFDEVYNAPDPRAYYRTLGALDYRIPSEARPVFRKVIDAIEAERPKIVDIGCSYGVNAAMVKYDLSFADLVERYSAPEMDDYSTAETVLKDAEDYAAMTPSVDASFVGVDIAGEAAGYAKAVGLIEEAVVENLEQRPLSDEAVEIMADADLLITTGAVGYVTERTFSRIIDAAAGDPPWIAAFVLRQFPFEPIADMLSRRGLACERLKDRYFIQRAFRDEGEAEGALAALRQAGVDPEGLETTGRYFAEFHLARPERAAAAAPLSALLVHGAPH